MGDSPDTSSGVVTRAKARASQTAVTGTEASPRAAETGAGSSSSRIGSSGSKPGSPRQQSKPVTNASATTQAALPDGTDSDSDSAGSGRKPAVQVPGSARSPPSSGREPKTTDQAQGTDPGVNGHQGPAGDAVPPPVAVSSPGQPGDNEPLWVQAWNIVNDNPSVKLLSCLAIFVLAIAFVYGNKSSSSTMPKATKFCPECFFINSTKLLFKKQFASQSVDTKLNILAQGEAMLVSSEPRQPSAITVLSPPGVSLDFTTCMIRKLSKVLNEAFEYYEPVKEITAQQLTSSRDVTSVHNDLNTYFHHGGRVVIFHGVDQLAREEHLNILHAYTDNFRAPFKRATFFFLLAVPHRIYNTRVQDGEWVYKHGGSIANQLLDAAWKNVVTADKRPAIIARITPTVILLNEGDQCWS